MTQIEKFKNLYEEEEEEERDNYVNKGSHLPHVLLNSSFILFSAFAVYCIALIYDSISFALLL